MTGLMAVDRSIDSCGAWASVQADFAIDERRGRIAARPSESSRTNRESEPAPVRAEPGGCSGNADHCWLRQ